MSTKTTSEALERFDAAVAAELPCVSTVEYNSHEICKWFAKNVRERFAALHPPGDQPATAGAEPSRKESADVLLNSNPARPA